MSNVVPFDPDLPRQIYNLYQGGLPISEIADRLDLSVREANIALRDYAAAQRAEEVVLDRLFLSRAELDRLGKLQDAYWLAALEGDQKAAAMILKIIEMRIKLLGLDDARNAQQVANILVVGKDKESFVAALMDGRNGDTDNQEEE